MYKIGDRVRWAYQRKFGGSVVETWETENNIRYLIKWDNKPEANREEDWFPSTEIVPDIENNDILKDLCSK